MNQTLTWADAGATLFMLLVVLAFIIGLAALVKRLNMRLPGHQGPVQVLHSTAVGQKERLVIVAVGEQKLLLGVTAHTISVLHTLPDDFKVPDKHQNQSSTFAQQVLQAVRRD
ncbi:flagellar biosynthetic protein FliO [Aliidiomarina maris]|uniref:Flagellar protein n=1 Tax=Aliidiomarina maris TaxID=531312 RepID=A0A327WRI0_9GAMM|nr:flagellar biosynthetic protein FliO [Aliidiomarina maris]RAJ94609.1 flagellar protein FliO/FliZ [Aliidiomarina maris]RUO19713.1 flagellar biosynthetic protein FliO [Aliidiomarina maris]